MIRAHGLPYHEGGSAPGRANEVLGIGGNGVMEWWSDGMVELNRVSEAPSGEDLPRMKG